MDSSQKASIYNFTIELKFTLSLFDKYKMKNFTNETISIKSKNSYLFFLSITLFKLTVYALPLPIIRPERHSRQII